jgi:hypothetical protein
MSTLNIHTSVTPELSSEYKGSVRLTTNQPISCEWLQHDQPAQVNLSDNDTFATNVEAGSYDIICTTCNGEHETVHVNVDKIKLLIVDKYIITHASSDMARDGMVQAIITQLEDHNVRFLWTSGVITDQPILHDVSPGIYALSIISTDNSPIPFYHICSPAHVKIRDNYE